MSPKPLTLLTDSHRQDAIQNIIDYFATERDEELGRIAAEDLLDMFLESIGPVVYNRAVDEAKHMLAQSHESLLAELELTLKKETTSR